MPRKSSQNQTSNLVIAELITDKENLLYYPSNAESLFERVKNFPSPSLVLDLHNVLDTTKYDQILGENICALSFTGRNSKIRDQAREELKGRIATGQIMYGVLVFKRQKGKKANTFQAPGSKAWFLKNLPTDEKLFVDDSEDHCESAKSLGLPYLSVLQYDLNSESLLEGIQRILL
jgi:hypothetical protein